LSLRFDKHDRELTDPYCSYCGGKMGPAIISQRGYNTKTGERNKRKGWACLNPTELLTYHDGYTSGEMPDA